MKKFSEFYAEKLNENVGNNLSGAEIEAYYKDRNKFRDTASRVKGMHPEVTVQMDKKDGSLHMWMGRQNIISKDGKLVAVTLKSRRMRPENEKHSDVVVQDQPTINEILSQINDDDSWWVGKGYLLYTTEIPKKYFMQTN